MQFTGSVHVRSGPQTRLAMYKAPVSSFHVVKGKKQSLVTNFQLICSGYWGRNNCTS